MANEERSGKTPPSYEELRARYMEEAQREHGGSPPFGGEREERFRTALEKIEAVTAAVELGHLIDELSDGRSGLMTAEQLIALDEWGETNEGLIELNRAVHEVMSEGTAFGFVEGQVADLEEVADAGLKIFELPETL